jgi:hypothetical protein
MSESNIRKTNLNVNYYSHNSHPPPRIEYGAGSDLPLEGGGRLQSPPLQPACAKPLRRRQGGGRGWGWGYPSLITDYGSYLLTIAVIWLNIQNKSSIRRAILYNLVGRDSRSYRSDSAVGERPYRNGKFLITFVFIH